MAAFEARTGDQMKVAKIEWGQLVSRRETRRLWKRRDGVGDRPEVMDRATVGDDLDVLSCTE